LRTGLLTGRWADRAAAGGPGQSSAAAGGPGQSSAAAGGPGQSSAVGPAGALDGIGLAAARRAIRRSGPRSEAAVSLVNPLIIEVEPRENMAAGEFTWGLA